ncbi:MAG: hypothetical protein ACJ741_03975 [Pyrinomonadaceae bacterium]
MQENFVTKDPEATLVQPRFDEAEAQTAQPVVPLRRAPVLQSRRLPVALVLVSALLGGLVSVVAYRLYLRPAQTQTAAQTVTTTPATQAPQDAAATPARQAAASPSLTASVPAKDETARADVPAESKPEESAPVVEIRAAKDEGKIDRTEADAKKRDERAPRESATHRDNTPRAASEDDAPRARRVDVIPAYPDGDRIGHDPRRDDAGAGDDPPPARRGGWRGGGHRVKGRNIDRIRDIFGAPPPG